MRYFVSTGTGGPRASIGRASRIMEDCERLREVLGHSDELDQATIRDYLEKNEASDWEEVLSSLSASEAFSSVGRDDARFSELLSFLDTVFSACVEEELEEHLRRTVNWSRELEARGVIDCVRMMAFKTNHQAMVRACKRNDLQVVHLLYRDGFRLESTMEQPETCARTIQLHDEGKQVKDMLREMTLLEAIGNPIYLLAEQRVDGTDPVHRAFQLIKVCRTIVSMKKAFINKVEAMENSLKSFLEKMLDLCEGAEEVELFLEQDDDIEEVSSRGTTLLPRIYQES